MAMDRILRAAIVAEVKQSMMDALEVANERWLTARELCDQFQMFSPSWLKEYGHLLPRTLAEVSSNEGTKCSRWAYPQHKIARMIADGTIKGIQNNC
jgi:hypothetical protein